MEVAMETEQRERDNKDNKDSSVTFHSISYLGAASIQDPKCESEIQSVIQLLNDNCRHPILVSLGVPTAADKGVEEEQSVVISEDGSSEPIAKYPISQLVFFARGLGLNSTNFSFTCSHGESLENLIYQCHVFRVSTPNQIQDAESGQVVEKIFTAFVQAFDSPTSLPQQQLTTSPVANDNTTTGQPGQSSPSQDDDLVYNYDLSLELREDPDGKHSYSTVCPRSAAGYFKLHSNTSKHVVITVQQQESRQQLVVERCFGLLLSPGRHVQDSDMNLLELLSWSIGNSTTGGSQKSYVVTGHWESGDPSFSKLNQETGENVVFMTVAVDLVVKNLLEPLRFSIPASARVYPPLEKFWSLQFVGGRNKLVSSYQVRLKRVQNGKYQLVSNKSLGEVSNLKSSGFTTTFTSFVRRSMEDDEDQDCTNEDEPLSGHGVLDKSCTDEQISSWSEVLNQWPLTSSTPTTLHRPKTLVQLVHRQGIPDTLRSEIWLRLANCHDPQNTKSMNEVYRRLLAKSYRSGEDEVIRRDITRTFSGNDYYREEAGQELLYKLCKAYGIYDEELGYFQGLTFIGAALLLQMPEEQSFILLTKIMYDYDFRSIYRDGFEQLRLKLYQFDRLLEDNLPEVSAHFQQLGIESHMYASQWFLTLYTAKFPLLLVYRVLDLYLCDGGGVMLSVGVALLKLSRRDLLTLDFESVLKFFRLALPKKYRKQSQVDELVKESLKIRLKKLGKFEADYKVLRESLINPLERLQLENKNLMQDSLRSENVITELVLAKCGYEERVVDLEEEVGKLKAVLRREEEFNIELKAELDSVKELLQREVRKWDEEGEKKQGIIGEYKRICSKLSSQLEESEKSYKEKLAFLQSNLCGECSVFANTVVSITKSSTATASERDNKSWSLVSTVEENLLIESELAKTKLQLAEAECRNDDLAHNLNLLTLENDNLKKSKLFNWRSLSGGGGGGAKEGGA